MKHFHVLFTASSPFLGSGSVGDDDLWYHRIPETLRSLSLSVPSFQVAPGPPAGSRALPASSETLSAYFRALSAGPGALTAGSETHPAGLRVGCS